jgi:hypothetical protein
MLHPEQQGPAQAVKTKRKSSQQVQAYLLFDAAKGWLAAIESVLRCCFERLQAAMVQLDHVDKNWPE